MKLLIEYFVRVQKIIFIIYYKRTIIIQNNNLE
jgi:hypothetical protein